MIDNAQPIETAPKDRRILGYGLIGFYEIPGWATVKWNSSYSLWQGDPNEATEYDPEKCDLTHWMPLPPPPHFGE
jgi:hypothetical protein